jgi:hypothetical protein
MDDKLKRFFATADKIRKGLEVSDDDLGFYLSFAPEIDETKIQDYLKADKNATREQAEAAVIEAGRSLQSSPVYKEQMVKLATDRKGAAVSEKISTGINLILAGTDIANSINQIRASNQGSSRAKKPGRPAIPQRDQYLQQALRSAEEGTFDAARALAPAQAQITDQYQQDIADAKTASTGQAGAYGAYRQLAANRRNRAALNLAPIADDIRAREQARYDNLLGMRQAETQRMFDNSAQSYGQDLDQYNTEQQAAASLGSMGRQNLRGSLYNLGNQIGPAVGNYYSRRKYSRLRNQASAAGLDADLAEKVNRTLDGYVGNMTMDNTPEYWNQIY